MLRSNDLAATALQPALVGHAAELAANLANLACIVVVGGDGTFHEVVQVHLPSLAYLCVALSLGILIIKLCQA
jgi:diacylglycerol kinase family enzyme